MGTTVRITKATAYSGGAEFEVVPAVMDKYDQSEWCTCLPKVEKDGKEYPPRGYVRHNMEEKKF